MRIVVIFEQAGRRVGIYPIEIESEGDLEQGVAGALRRFRKETGLSLFDNILVRVERDV